MSKRKAKVVVNAVEDDDATELSGREAQRIAGLNADHGKLAYAVGTVFCIVQNARFRCSHIAISLDR